MSYVLKFFSYFSRKIIEKIELYWEKLSSNWHYFFGSSYTNNFWVIMISISVIPKSLTLKKFERFFGQYLNSRRKPSRSPCIFFKLKTYIFTEFEIHLTTIATLRYETNYCLVKAFFCDVKASNKELYPGIFPKSNLE